MSMSDATEQDIWKLIFNATALPWAAITNIVAALHSADPADAGVQTTSEVAYGGYARQNVARTSGGWTVTSAAGATQASPVANINFPAATSGTTTATFWSAGTALTGAGQILLSGPIVPNIPISTGVIPQLTTQTALTID